ncbi:hypothetical protein MMC14_003076 [Varicellaria rhodocarpa]|nr:hypothetical protein [Varicellaria rhodocarpa]
MPADSRGRPRSRSEKRLEILFSPDIFDEDGSLNDRIHTKEPDLCNQPRFQLPEPLAAKQHSSRHVNFQEPIKTRQQTLIHPLFRKRRYSGRAGTVTPLDHRIARHGGTTSSYEELPHRLRLSKKHQPLTPEERIIELTYEKSFLLQELVYRKETQIAEMKFLDKVTKLRAEMKNILEELDCALEERSKERVSAESDLCSYWGINFGDGNVEDLVF